ncbi:MAG: hypothetical protein AB1646_21140 [Thermodesulfobacteriota bacterium]
MNDTNKDKTTTISKASTIEEISDYWDEHSLSDHWEETREVSCEIRAVRRRRVTIDPEIYAQLEVAAQQRGVTTETLANLWLAQQLRERALHPAAPTQ